jgi:hypothetical protein
MTLESEVTFSGLMICAASLTNCSTLGICIILAPL